ncbi:MAG: glycosyltransferase [Eubacteriales bacterium]|nr:glycosyltransferase [Eubacteriales bacterium]
MTPLVSICTTTYNHEKYLEKALESFLKQKTSFPFEILIHDDHSSDGTVEIIQRYAARYPEIVKPLYEEVNQYSQNVPINETFNFPRAQGKYIALCEGDDYWTDEGKLQAQADYMEAHPDCTFCFTNGIIEDQTGARQPREFIPYREEERTHYYAADHRYELGEMCELNFVPTATFFFPRAVLMGMPSCFGDKMCQHGDLKMRLFFTAAGYGMYLHRFTCVYRENVAGSAFQVWTKESAALTARRAATVTEMLRDVDEYSRHRYTPQVRKLMDRYLYVELWNTDQAAPLKNPDLQRAYRQLTATQKLKYHLKRLLPRRFVDGLKRIVH